ncbi:MAG: HD domain-containing phosphohydrolase [Planctomycetota bacterium]
MSQLRIKKGPGVGKVYPTKDKSTILGRDPKCDIQLGDKSASREHAEVFKLGEMYFIRDLHSRNGTMVNGELIDEELLREGDIIQIGETEIAYQEKDMAVGDTGPDAGEDSLFDDSADLGSTMEFHLDEMAKGKPESSKDLENLKTIYHIGKVLNAEVSGARLMDEILEIILKKIDADNVYIFMKDADSSRFKPVAKKVDPVAGDVKVSRTIIKKAINETRAILTNNAMSDERFSAKDSIVINRIRSVICAPLVTQHMVSGVLYISRNRPGQGFVTEDLELATAVATQVGMALENLRSRREQHELFIDMIKALISAGELQHPESKGHSERTSAIATNLAKRMQLTLREVSNVRIAALLHDVGKIGLAPGADPHAARNADYMKREAIQNAAKILENVSKLEYLLPAIRHQFERFDGTGLPDGLKGQAIPVFARIIAAADAFDTMTTHGGLRGEGFPPKEAIHELRREAGTAFDPEVVAALEYAFGEGALFTDDMFLNISS